MAKNFLAQIERQHQRSIEAFDELLKLTDPRHILYQDHCNIDPTDTIIHRVYGESNG